MSKNNLEYQKEYYQKNKERRKAYMKEYKKEYNAGTRTKKVIAEVNEEGSIKCRVCSEFKPRDSFYVNKACKLGVDLRCKKCTSIFQAERYKAEKETEIEDIRERMKRIPTKVHFMGIFH